MVTRTPSGRLRAAPAGDARERRGAAPARRERAGDSRNGVDLLHACAQEEPLIRARPGDEQPAPVWRPGELAEAAGAGEERARAAAGDEEDAGAVESAH